MAYKILSAEDHGTSYRFKVLLDETKVISVPTEVEDRMGVKHRVTTGELAPDPEWVREWTWGAEPPAVPDYPADHKGDRARPLSKEAYMKAILEMIEENVKVEMALLGHLPTAARPLPIPGDLQWH